MLWRNNGVVILPQINLTISRNLFSPTLFPLLEDYTHRFEGYKGSAGSGKSYFITQKIIYRCVKEKIRVLVCRRYATTLRNTCFSLFKEVLDKWKLTPYVKIRETDFNIRFPNGSEIIFTGLDEETKLLSLANITTIFVEEVYEVGEQIFEQLNLRLRGGVNQQIIFAFNPISKNHWLYNFCVVSPPQSFIFSETTYKDNPFLSAEYVASLEDLITRNPAKAKIYCFGEWGNDQEGLVFQNWKVENFDYMELAKKLEHRVGLDFGFLDPTAIVSSLYDKENKRIYVVDCFEKSGLQLDQIADQIRKMNLQKSVIYCDSAEPRSISYLKSQGFHALPCIKGKDSVEARILFLQNHEIIILPHLTDIINEFENFAYKRDRDGKMKDGEYTHEFSHTIDSLGYAYSNIYTKNKIRTMEKSVLGL